ncbi:hypothetical protein UA08_07829 [Talaromyces atroroseus]|uniref:Uncharacterized protein n=1 Tax=Talaromyces atroroseus TaxID=1441469 RepID=A0A225A8C5_TALAT|nr:hypothetical protein UA08_07829 [Talaromyces atroroseus]OKL56862.1 hypothetical protein UA08_07829 [Talaromyces atroroseus]
MALRSDSSLLWLVLGVSLGFVAARRIVHDLYQVRELTQITRPENDERMISQGTEDGTYVYSLRYYELFPNLTLAALKLETLHKLTESPSYELRGASLRIISERATKESSRDQLLKDLTSDSKRRRNRALTAIHFLVSSRALSRSSLSPRLKDLPTYTAIVDCLCNFLEEHTVEYGTTESPILPKTRPPGEKKLLATLNILLAENLPAALEAGVVSRWLSKYPFPCLTNNIDIDDNNNTNNKYRRRDVVWLMKTYWLDDTIMSSIVTTLVSNTDGIRQLRKHGLMGSVMQEENDFDEADNDVWMINGESTAGSRWVPERLPLPDESFEEQALRRRRREAMVFSENGGPIGSENIIQPLSI